ncbi:FKBP-type peptidyl-prolyl cis-trans isomerase N-terminal domain-containing protein [Legionella sp. W05-934-2]|uniref:FKBP-type peptidyl-prolyl cis-trans isomerase N-terminal domain-containing protein n=1 Tax=Legionella sp. W05-934-2 TaxID=1198649 RepID=UPI003461CFEA
MRIKLVTASVISVALSTAAYASEQVMLNSEMDKVSYSIGADLGQKFKQQNIKINPEALAAGLKDGLSGGNLQLNDEQMKQVMTAFQKSLIAKRTQEYKQQALENKAKGEAFLEKNKQDQGVVELPSGLQYKILTKGSGAKPSKDDIVKVEYTGRLIDGKVFDSSEKLGKPAEFKVSQVIPGWVEALQLMPSGSTWEVYVPAKLAYGERSVGGMIGPNETLIFKIHLISIEKDKKQSS